MRSSAPHPAEENASIISDNLFTVEPDDELHLRVNMFFQLKERWLAPAFAKFNASNRSHSTVMMLSAFISLLSIPILGVLVRSLIHDSGDAQLIHLIITIFAILAINVCGWVQCWVRKYVAGDTIILVLRRVQTASFFVLSIILCYHVIAQDAGPPCSKHNDGGIQLNCRSLGRPHVLAHEFSVIAMFVPIMYCVCTRGADFEWSLALWGIAVITLLFCVSDRGDIDSVLFLFFYVIGSAALLIQGCRQNYRLFFAHLRIQEFLRDRERANEVANAQEMRHMIANVAHDLKTPLSSFVSGIEFVSQIVENMAAAQASEAPLSLRTLAEWVRDISECLTSIRNTNAFMLMTINRSIDFTKASKGLKLVPHQETIDLMEALSLPFKCMTDIQQRIPLQMEPWDRNICSHIITDKQWLQENLLCLLSNAVKFSNEGLVVVRVERVRDHPNVAAHRVAGGTDSDVESVATSVRPLSRSKSLGAPSAPVASITQLEEYPQLAGVDPHVLADEGADHDEFLRFEVEDHGIGLTDQAMTTLFNPFKQAQRLVGGAGLGLYSLEKRLEALGGRCGVQHRRDGTQGALFWFIIPYRPDLLSAAAPPGGQVHTPFASLSHSGSAEENYRARAVEPDRSLSPSPPPTQPSDNPQKVAKEEKTFQGLSVLVVDDSPAIVKMTTMMLKKHHHQVAVAANGAEAVRMVCDHVRTHGRGFDAVLMDLQMPIMDGLEATRRVRHMETTGVWVDNPSSRSCSIDCEGAGDGTDVEVSVKLLPPSPNPIHNIIIGVSANSDAETIREARVAGVDAFIAKPFAIQAFYRRYDQLGEQLGGASPTPTT